MTRLEIVEYCERCEILRRKSKLEDNCRHAEANEERMQDKYEIARKHTDACREAFLKFQKQHQEA